MELLIRQVQVPCEECGGLGRRAITHEMAQDAGLDLQTSSTLRCFVCQGDGWTLETEEIETCRVNPTANP